MLLAEEYQHPQLVRERTLVTAQLRRVVEVQAVGGPGTKEELRAWSDGFRTAPPERGGTRGVPPCHWQTEEVRKAGTGPIRTLVWLLSTEMVG